GVGWRGEMVGRGGAEFGGELGAARWGELVGVEPDAHPEPLRRPEDPPRLVGAEHALLAEDVAVARAAVGRHPWELLLDDRADVRLGPIRSRSVFGRDGVGAEIRGDDVDRALATEPPGRLDQLDLGLEVEPVPGLRLDGRDAVAEHLVEP